MFPAQRQNRQLDGVWVTMNLLSTAYTGALRRVVTLETSGDWNSVGGDDRFSTTTILRQSK